MAVGVGGDIGHRDCLFHFVDLVRVLELVKLVPMGSFDRNQPHELVLVQMNYSSFLLLPMHSHKLQALVTVTSRR